MVGDPFESQRQKKACQGCARHVFCLRLHKVLTSLALAEETAEDLEYRIRFQSLMQELVGLGYDFPLGHQHCQLSKLDSRSSIDLLREAQELLLDVRNYERLGEEERKQI